MNAHTDINAALAARNMLALDCTCPACGDDRLTRDDMASAVMFHALTLTKMEERYGAPVCFGCADSHRLCGGCDAAISEAEIADTDYDSGETFCEKCAVMS